MALILVASVFLVIVLLLASWIDYKTHNVPDFIWFIVGATCLLLMIQLNLDADTLAKTQILALTVAYIIITYLIGDKLFNKGYYGGADVKFAMAVSVLLASFGLIGMIFYLWFLILYPLFIFISLKLVSAERKKVTMQTKFAFIPFMTLMFLGICLIHILSVN